MVFNVCAKTILNAQYKTRLPMAYRIAEKIVKVHFLFNLILLKSKLCEHVIISFHNEVSSQKIFTPTTLRTRTVRELQMPRMPRRMFRFCLSSFDQNYTPPPYRQQQTIYAKTKQLETKRQNYSNNREENRKLFLSRIAELIL